jgi:Sulfotransferase domain
MRVIGAGFGRTGTTSLKAALEELGFGPSYTLREVFQNPEHARVWEAASGPAGGVVDWPACSLYEELMEAFPGAPVILTVRDPAEWYESTRSTIHELRRLTTAESGAWVADVAAPARSSRRRSRKLLQIS